MEEGGIGQQYCGDLTAMACGGAVGLRADLMDCGEDSDPDRLIEWTMAHVITADPGVIKGIQGCNAMRGEATASLGIPCVVYRAATVPLIAGRARGGF